MAAKPTMRLLPVIATLALGLSAFQFLDTLLNAQHVFSDWHAYYRAAENLRAGEDIYQEGKVLLERNSYDYWVHTDGQYVYPPLLALLIVPLTLVLDIGKAGDVWLLILALATVGFLVLMLSILRHPVRVDTLALVGIPVLAAVPLLLSVRYGQVDLLLLLLLTVSLLAYLRQRDILAGLALGLAAAIKPLFLFYALFYLRKRRWRTLVTMGMTGLIVGLGPFLLFPSASFTDWLAISRYFSGADYPSYPSNQSARGLLLRAFAGGPQHNPLIEAPWLVDGLWLGLILVVAGLLWWCVSGYANRDRRAVEEFALLIALVLFISPLSEDIHYVVILLPLAVLADRVAHNETPHWWGALAIIALLYYMQPWLDFAYNRGGTDLRRLVASGAYVYGLVLVGTSFIIRLRHRAPYTIWASEAAQQQPADA